jgi:hypothetical protein
MSSILSKEQQDIRKANGVALLKAIAYLCYNEATTLIEQGNIDLEVTDQDGFTPIYSACNRNNPELAKLLLEHGANPNVATKDGFTPIFKACSGKNPELAKLLLEYGANPNVVTKHGFTPIDCNSSVEKLLLIAGAEVRNVEQIKKVINLTDQQFCEQFEVIQKDDGSVRYLFKDRVKKAYDQIIQEKLDKTGVIATDVAALFNQPEQVKALAGALHKTGFAQMLTEGDSKCLHKAVRTKQDHAESNITCRKIEKAARKTFSKELDKNNEKWADRTGESFGIPLGLF